MRDGAEKRQVTEGDGDSGDSARAEADRRRLNRKNKSIGKRKGGQTDGRCVGGMERDGVEKVPLVAEESRVRTRAIDLAKSLGLSSSSGSEEDESYMETFRVDEPLALLADDCHPAGIEELDPGMVDEEWR